MSPNYLCISQVFSLGAQIDFSAYERWTYLFDKFFRTHLVAILLLLVRIALPNKWLSNHENMLSLLGSALVKGQAGQLPQAQTLKRPKIYTHREDCVIKFCLGPKPRPNKSAPAPFTSPTLSPIPAKSHSHMCFPLTALVSRSLAFCSPNFRIWS